MKPWSELTDHERIQRTADAAGLAAFLALAITLVVLVYALVHLTA